MKSKEITIPRLFITALVPSAIFTILYLGIGSVWQSIPSIDLFFILSSLTLFVFEIVSVLLANKREYGRVGLQIVFAKYKKMAWWKILLYGLALFCIAGLMSVSIGALENMLFSQVSEHFYRILPAYFDWNNFEQMKQYPNSMIIFTAVFYLIMNVLVCLIIEEIYFRGYLTAKMRGYGIAAPILVSVAFSLYHWWLPCNNIFRICIFAVAFTVAYKKENIYISIVFHCLCNLFSSIGFVKTLLVP